MTSALTALDPRSTFEVVVPASTSNLGPGFDFLGLALSLSLRVRVLGPSDLGSHVLETLDGTCATWPRSDDNLLLRAFDRACTAPLPKRRFAASSDIPIARGLGSSGAAVAAGLLLGAFASGGPPDLQRLLELGLALEGHPDNSSAALVGGCTLAVPLTDGRLRVVRQELHPDLGFVLAWPPSPLPTSAARRVLPRQVPFADAVENPRRLALLLEGLRHADPELLALGGEDRLHVQHRLPLIAGGAAALAAARAAGAWLATISGSGSALIAIAAHERTAEIGACMARALSGGDGSAASRVVTPVFGTPVVRVL